MFNSHLIFVDHKSLDRETKVTRIHAQLPLHLVRDMYKSISFVRVVYISFFENGKFTWDGYCNGKVRWNERDETLAKWTKISQEVDEIVKEERIANRKDILKAAIG